MSHLSWRLGKSGPALTSGVSATVRSASVSRPSTSNLESPPTSLHPVSPSPPARGGAMLNRAVSHTSCHARNSRNWPGVARGERLQPLLVGGVVPHGDQELVDLHQGHVPLAIGTKAHVRGGRYRHGWARSSRVSRPEEGLEEPGRVASAATRFLTFRTCWRRRVSGGDADAELLERLGEGCRSISARVAQLRVPVPLARPCEELLERGEEVGRRWKAPLAPLQLAEHRLLDTPAGGHVAQGQPHLDAERPEHLAVRLAFDACLCGAEIVEGARARGWHGRARLQE